MQTDSGDEQLHPLTTQPQLDVNPTAGFKLGSLLVDPSDSIDPTCLGGVTMAPQNSITMSKSRKKQLKAKKKAMKKAKRLGIKTTHLSEIDTKID